MSMVEVVILTATISGIICFVLGCLAGNRWGYESGWQDGICRTKRRYK